jgi:starch-binding outer membrane protein, SusD/RagB family
MLRRTFNGFAAAALVFLGAAGCTDPTVEPRSTVTEANTFSDPLSYRRFLAKIYAGLTVTGQQGPAGDRDIFSITDEGFSQYMRLYWKMQVLPTDEAVIAWGDQGLPELNTQVWGSSNRFVAGMYSRIFFQVMMANEFLRQTTDGKLDERGVSGTLRTDIQTFRAEARFLRALSYWHGLDLIGNIPLVTEEAEIGGDPPEQATRTEIFNFLVTELNAILGQLPPAGPGVYGRATDAAAHMLLAKLYLNAEVYTGTPNYAGALNEASAVIAGPFSLDDNYQDIFLADNNTSPEIVFPVIHDGQRTQSFGGTNFLIHASCGNSMNAADYGVDGCWWGIRLKPEAHNLYAAGDGRAANFFTTNQTVAITSISNFAEGIPNPKFQNKTSTGGTGSNPAYADTDYPMFRLADAYLIYAEAVVRGGGGTRAQALTYINLLRQRAYGDNSGDITDPQMDAAFILAERGRELMWEGHRRNDLVRYGLFTGGAYVWAWKGNVAAGTATDAHLDLYPIPASELSANPNLTQNPGY